MTKKKVLITGAAGLIGRTLRAALRNRYALRLMYHNTIFPAVGEEEAVIADIGDFQTVLRATKGTDAVVHLALGQRKEWSDWESAHFNMVGTYHVFEAARLCGVGKIVFASTNHVTGFTETMMKDDESVLRPIEDRYAGPETPPRPDSLYGVGKGFGEILARFYVDRYGMSIICLRIGSFRGRDPPGPLSGRVLSTWISNRDIAQLVELSLESELPFGIFYGVSRNSRRYWDISNAQELLGYSPLDDAEQYAAKDA